MLKSVCNLGPDEKKEVGLGLGAWGWDTARTADCGNTERAEVTNSNNQNGRFCLWAVQLQFLFRKITTTGSFTMSQGIAHLFNNSFFFSWSGQYRATPNFFFSNQFPFTFSVWGDWIKTFEENLFSETRSEPKATQNNFLHGNCSISVKFDNSLFLQNKTLMPNWSWQYHLKMCHSGYKQEMFRVLIQWLMNVSTSI